MLEKAPDAVDAGRALPLRQGDSFLAEPPLRRRESTSLTNGHEDEIATLVASVLDA